MLGDGALVEESAARGIEADGEEGGERFAFVLSEERGWLGGC